MINFIGFIAVELKGRPLAGELMDDKSTAPALSVTVLAIAEELGVTLSGEHFLLAVGRDANMFLSHVLGRANRIRKHKGKRTLTVSDINESLESDSLEPLRGYRDSAAQGVVKIGESEGLDVLAFSDKQRPLSDFRRMPLKTYPLDITFDFHWLAVHGVQPQIEQNLTSRSAGCYIPDTHLRGLPDQTHFGNQSIVMISSKTPVSAQLQEHFVKYSEIIKKQASSSSEVKEFKQFVDCLGTEPAFQPLIPFYLRTIREMIMNNPKSPSQLQTALTMARAIFQNQNFEIEGNLFSLFVIATTLATSKGLGDDPLDELCSLRDSAGDFMGLIVQHCREKYPELEARLADHLLSIIVDPREIECTRYGATVALMMVNSKYISTMLIDRLQQVLRILREKMNHSDHSARLQMAHVIGAIERFCGICLNIDVSKGVPEEALKVYDVVVKEFGASILSFFAKK